MGISESTYDANLSIARTNYLAVRDRLIDMEKTMVELFDDAEPWRVGYEPQDDPLEVIRELTERLFSIDQLMNIHLYAKLNIEQRDALLAGKNAQRVIGTTKYIVTDYDTPHSIEEKFGVSWNDIADYNGVSPLELESLEEIEIPVPNDDLMNMESYQNNPVYCAHIGAAALGRDVDNDLQYDAASDDLRVLDNTNTFSQGIRNILRTETGEMPGDRQWGFNQHVGEDIPDMAKDAFVKLRILEAFARESRIQDVISLDITRQNGLGWNIKAVVKPINSLTVDEFTDLIEVV